MKENGTVGFSCASSCAISVFIGTRIAFYTIIVLILFAIRRCLAPESMIQIRTVVHRVEGVPLPRTLALPLHVFAELAIGHRAFVVLNTSVSQKLNMTP